MTDIKEKAAAAADKILAKYDNDPDKAINALLATDYNLLNTYNKSSPEEKVKIATSKLIQYQGILNRLIAQRKLVRDTAPVDENIAKTEPLIALYQKIIDLLQPKPAVTLVVPPLGSENMTPVQQIISGPSFSGTYGRLDILKDLVSIYSQIEPSPLLKLDLLEEFKYDDSKSQSENEKNLTLHLRNVDNKWREQMPYYIAKAKDDTTIKRLLQNQLRWQTASLERVAGLLTKAYPAQAESMNSLITISKDTTEALMGK